MSSRLAYLNTITEYLKYNIFNIQNENIKLSEITWDDISRREGNVSKKSEAYNDFESALPNDLVFNDLSRYIQKLFCSILDEPTTKNEWSTDNSSVDSHQISYNNDSSSSNAERATLSSLVFIEENPQDINKVSLIIDNAKQASENLRSRFILSQANQNDLLFSSQNSLSHSTQNVSSVSTQYSSHQNPKSISEPPAQNISKVFLERSLQVLFKMCMSNYFHYIQSLEVKLNEIFLEEEKSQDIRNSGVEIINKMYYNMIKTFYFMNYRVFEKNHISALEGSHKYISFEDQLDNSLSEKLDLDIFDFFVNNTSPFQSYISDTTSIEANNNQSDETTQNYLIQFVKLLNKHKPELSEQILPTLYKGLLCTNKEESEPFFASIEIKLRPLNIIHQCFINLVELLKYGGLTAAFMHNLKTKLSKKNPELPPDRFSYDKSNWWDNFTHSYSKRSLLKSILYDFVKIKSAPQFYILLSKINDWSLGHLRKDALYDVIDSLPQEINNKKKSQLRHIVEYEEYTHEFFRKTVEPNTPIYHPFASLTQQDHLKWDRLETPSYKSLPPNMPKIICSGRNKRLKCVLNDDWVSVPENSESSPKQLNTHEEALFRIEDLRYSADMKIGRVSSLLKFLNSIQIDLKVKERLNEPYIAFSPCSFSPVHKSILKEIYGFHTNDILNSVCQDPCNYLEILLSCLEDKLYEWINSKQNLDNNYWRLCEQTHWCYILDGTQRSYHNVESGKRYFTRSSRHIDL